ncbi:MAG: glycosyltransferase family 9 protein, partial [Candidatus Omnitrophica bacterium]|nr:glycosyltransferase family 9 protein [Candidatus Omnitrophota bacterium]
MKSYRNILIIRTDRIGDVVLTTSILQPLRQCFPKSRISMLVSPVTFDLVNGHKDIDEVFVDDRADLHKGLAGFLRLIKEIKRKDFDVAIIFHTKKRTNALCYFAGIPRRIGYRNNKFGFLLTDSLTDQRHLGEKHETQYCLEVVQYLAGKKVLLGENKIMINSQAEQWAENLFKENKIDATRKIIAIHLGASDPAKCWPQENFIEVITQLQKKYPAVILLIGAQNTSN